MAMSRLPTHIILVMILSVVEMFGIIIIHTYHLHTVINTVYTSTNTTDLQLTQILG